MRDALRILLSIHHELDPDSGAPGTTLALGNTYAKLGHDVRYLSFDNFPGHPPDRFAAVAYPALVAIRLLRAAGRNLDVIDASTGDTWIWAALTRKRDRPLLVTTSHGLEHLYHERVIERTQAEGEQLSWRYPLYSGGWRLYEVTRSIQAADLVFVLNDSERNYVIDRLGVAPERVRVTANGLSDRFLDLAKSTNTTGDHTAVACVGGYRTMKGVEYGARALSSVMNAYPALTTSLIGTGAPRGHVLSRFPSHLHSRIATVERYRRDELPKLLEGHGILLSPSLSEGFGLAVLEGMGCGLAPVAAENHGVRQIVRSEHNGVLVPSRDAPALRATLVRLLDDRPLLRNLQKGARRTALRYSWRRIGADRVRAYREALARRSMGELPLART